MLDAIKRREELKNLKLSKLQKICESHKISINGTKNEIIERIVRYEVKLSRESEAEAAEKDMREQIKAANLASSANSTKTYQSEEDSKMARALTQVVAVRISKSHASAILDLSSCYDKCGANFNFHSISEDVLAALQNDKLKQLWMANNSLITIPISVCKMTASSLTTMSFARNRLYSIPSEIGLLVKLERLILSNNRIASVPVEITNLKNLKEFIADDNKFTKFPTVLTEITSLRVLNLSNNFIDELPADIQKLRKLVELHLDGNKIATIAGEIANLNSSLRTLGLSRNVLENDLPVLKRLTNLTVVRLHGNRSSIFGPIETRPDGYLKTAESVKSKGGVKIGVPVPGYISESIEYNTEAGSWYKETDSYCHELLLNRAKHRPWKIKV